MCNLAKTSNLKFIQNLFIYYYFKTFSLIYNEVSVATTRLHRFSCPSYSTLLKIVDPLASKSCELDPVPSLSW